MKEQLVKILENTVDPTSLNEVNINEYLQAKRTISTFNAGIVLPFRASAYSSKNEYVYDDKNIRMEVILEHKKQKYSPKNVVNLFESTLNNAITNNSNQKRMYGIKRFREIVGIDIEYAQQLFNAIQAVILDDTIIKTLEYTGNNIQQIAQEHTGRLIMPSSSSKNKIEFSDVALYIAAERQMELLTDKIVKPFERVFKKNAIKSVDKTIFDNKAYGNLIVQVKSVPAKVPNYQSIIEKISSTLYNCQAHGFQTFHNDQLNRPRPYVAIDEILGAIAASKDITYLKYRQEIKILYGGEKNLILSR